MPGGAASGIGGGGVGEIDVAVADEFPALGGDGAAVVFVIMPVVFGKDEEPGDVGGIFEDGSEVDAFEAFSWSEAGEFEEGGGDIDGTDEAFGALSGFDAGWPICDPRGADAAVVEGGFVTGERASVVADEKDEGVVGDALLFEFGHDFPDIKIEASDFVVESW